LHSYLLNLQKQICPQRVRSSPKWSRFMTAYMQSPLRSHHDLECTRYPRSAVYSRDGVQQRTPGIRVTRSAFRSATPSIASGGTDPSSLREEKKLFNFSGGSGPVNWSIDSSSSLGLLEKIGSLCVLPTKSHDAAGQWFRSYGNENWEFNDNGLMTHRHASINDLPIKESERLYHWPLGRRPDDHPSLSDLGL
jgi:Protein of unknown function (DUF1348)